MIHLLLLLLLVGVNFLGLNKRIWQLSRIVKIVMNMDGG